MKKDLKWICDKHNRILELSNVKGNETLDELASSMNEIYSITVDAKEDGQKMEDALIKQKEINKDLNRKLESLGYETIVNHKTS